MLTGTTEAFHTSARTATQLAVRFATCVAGCYCQNVVAENNHNRCCKLTAFLMLLCALFLSVFQLKFGSKICASGQMDPQQWSHKRNSPVNLEVTSTLQ